MVSDEFCREAHILCKLSSFCSELAGICLPGFESLVLLHSEVNMMSRGDEE